MEADVDVSRQRKSAAAHDLAMETVNRPQRIVTEFKQCNDNRSFVEINLASMINLNI